MLASDVFTAVQTLLQDATFKDRYPADVLLIYLNDAIVAIIDVRPDALTRHDLITLVAGTVQNLPADSIALVDVIRNRPTGRTCMPFKRQNLDAFDPGWHDADPADEVVNWNYEPKDRKTFYVTPPNSGNARQLEIVTSYVPTPLAAASNTVPLHDVYKPLLVDYVAWRCLLMDTEMKGALEKAGAYLTAFTQRLSGQQSRAIVDPAAPATRGEGS